METQEQLAVIQWEMDAARLARELLDLAARIKYQLDLRDYLTLPLDKAAKNAADSFVALDVWLKANKNGSNLAKVLSYGGKPTPPPPVVP